MKLPFQIKAILQFNWNKLKCKKSHLFPIYLKKNFSTIILPNCNLKYFLRQLMHFVGLQIILMHSHSFVLINHKLFKNIFENCLTVVSSEKSNGQNRLVFFKYTLFKIM